MSLRLATFCFLARSSSVICFSLSLTVFCLGDITPPGRLTVHLLKVCLYFIAILFYNQLRRQKLTVHLLKIQALCIYCGIVVVLYDILLYLYCIVLYRTPGKPLFMLFFRDHSWIIGRFFWVKGRKLWVWGRNNWVQRRLFWVLGRFDWVPGRHIFFTVNLLRVYARSFFGPDWRAFVRDKSSGGSSLLFHIRKQLIYDWTGRQHAMQNIELLGGLPGRLSGKGSYLLLRQNLFRRDQKQTIP